MSFLNLILTWKLVWRFVIILKNVIQKHWRKSIHAFPSYASFSYICAPKSVRSIDPSRLERVNRRRKTIFKFFVIFHLVVYLMSHIIPNLWHTVDSLFWYNGARIVTGDLFLIVLRCAMLFTNVIARTHSFSTTRSSRCVEPSPYNHAAWIGVLPWPYI